MKFVLMTEAIRHSHLKFAASSESQAHFLKPKRASDNLHI